MQGELPAQQLVQHDFVVLLSPSSILTLLTLPHPRARWRTVPRRSPRATRAWQSSCLRDGHKQHTSSASRLAALQHQAGAAEYSGLA